MTRSYPDHAQPLWRRVLLTREAAVLVLLVAVAVYSNSMVPNFSGPLTLPFLILDVTPILLIALPMTLVIVT
jgi:rhamnose transport system permease protein